MRADRLKKLMILPLMWLLTGCGGTGDPAVDRARLAAKATGEIQIGVGWPDAEKSLFRKALDLAMEEVNGKGGVKGRPLKLVGKSDDRLLSQGKVAAQEFADNLEMVAVIGHLNSYISAPVSITYQYYGLLMMSPGSTTPKLTQQGFSRVFRNIPSDKQIGQQMADFAKKQGYKSVAVCNVNNAYGQGLANIFEWRAEELGMDIVDRRAFDSVGKSVNFRDTLRQWKNRRFDAIFIAGSLPEGGHIISQIREVGIKAPILAGDGMGFPELVALAGPAAEGVVSATTFHLDDPRPEVQAFKEKFHQKYHAYPDARAAQGYDALRVVVHAMEQAGTTAPDQVAAALKKVKDWQGVTGPHSFDQNGDVVDKPIIKQVVRNGRLEFLLDAALPLEVKAAPSS
ncbi:MAG: ABC transporter substrate-binding protein [Magnetococcales bacterium]|nr:ABC transporter substrate-binding protein [Magnetococcales bacterium]